jgi:hypothetical protein
MARSKGPNLAAKLKSSQPPKLLIVGAGQLVDRRATLLRIRDDLTQELKEVAVGPLYLLIDIALQSLIHDLRSRPDGSIEVIQGPELDHGRLPKYSSTKAKPS